MEKSAITEHTPYMFTPISDPISKRGSKFICDGILMEKEAFLDALNINKD